MDIATLGLRVDSNGFVRAMGDVERSSNRATRSGERAERMARQLRNTLAAFGGALGLQQLVAYADTWNLIQGRLGLVTSGTRNLGTVQNEVFAGAQRARVGFEATASLYTKLARNAESLGASQRELLTVTEATNKAFIVSGASAGETDAAVRQLGQAFASGALRGDELNSVLENAPRLAEAIATGMGATVGQLRAMGRAGELTSKQVFDAIHSQAGAIEEEFGRMPTTVGQSMSVLRNELMRFVGAGDNATGMSKALADTVLLVSRNLGTLFAILAAGGTAWLVYTNAAKLAAFWTAAVAAAQTIAAYVSLAMQVRNAAGAMTLFGMATKGAVAFLTGPAGIAIALGLAVAGLVTYRQRANEAARANDEFAASLANMSKMQVDVTEADLDTQMWEAERRLAQMREQGQQFRTTLRPDYNLATGPSGLPVLRQVQVETDAYRQQAAVVRGLFTDLAAVERHREALAELELRPDAAPVVTPTALDAGVVNEERSRLAQLARDTRNANEDALRQAQQLVEMARAEGAAQERLALDHHAVNREVEARRTLQGDMLADTLRNIAAERELGVAALQASAAAEEGRGNAERIAAARVELDLARQGADERVRINADADREIAAARQRLGDVLAGLLPGTVAAINEERRLRLETVATNEAMEERAGIQERQQAVLDDFRGRVAGTFEGLFEGVFTRGLDGFRQFFSSVHQMLARMVAEMLTRTVMARIGNALAGSLAGVFGDLPGAAAQAPSPSALAMQGAGSTMLQASLNMQTAAGTMAGAAATQAAPVTLDLPSAEAQQSFAASLAQYLGPALAGFAAGRVVGGLTGNRLLGTAGGALSGAASGAMVGSAFGPGGALLGAGIGALTGAIGGWLGSNRRREEAERRTADLLRQNNARMLELKQSNDALAMSGPRLVAGAALAARLMAALESGQVGRGAAGRALAGEVDSPALRQMERTYGISFAQLAAIARDTGIQLYDSAGKLVPAALAQLAEAIGYAVERITTISNSIADQEFRQQARNKIFGTPDTPDQKLSDAYAILREGAPDLFRMLGLDNLDLSTQGGRDALSEGFKEIFRLIDSGALTPEMLGAFPDWRALLTAIMGATDALGAFREALDGVTTDYPHAMRLLLWEQEHGRGVQDRAPAPQGPTAPPATGSGGARPGGAVASFSGPITVHITPSANDSGEAILRKIEDAAADRAVRGGYTYLPRTVIEA